MLTADQIYDRYPEFIREYIYRSGWQELREVQMQAAQVIFGTQDNLLLSSSTASGKTEAVIFPILADLLDNPPEKQSVSVLYIAPLKSLINDQFQRMGALLDASSIPVCHWHGEVSGRQKSHFLKHPEGILQITPESLESMLIRRNNDIPRIFASLRYIILDEIHILIGTDRGNQILCQLARLDRLIGYHPRRIGLSATIGDLEIGAQWLGAGNGRHTEAPVPSVHELHWRLGMEHFYIQNPNLDQQKDAGNNPQNPRATLDAGYEFLYDAVKDKKALVFSNSREETEYTTATLRQIAEKRGDDDIFMIHHGNLSGALREDAELRMKDDGVGRAVTCATVTMELGIDIGRLERVAQVSAPTTVAGFLQRLGRSGRRGSPPEMIMVFREEQPLPNAPLPELIPWDLLRAIAIVELHLKERFIEPPSVRQLPYSLLYHQTLSVLAASVELSPASLAERVLSMPPFSKVPKERYKQLLVEMIHHDDLELTEQKGLIIGLRGERLIAGYKFFAVFKDSEDFTVRCGSDEIGTISTPPPAGDRFALAGRVWEVIEVDVPRRLVYVNSVKGKMKISWPGDGGEIHTRILEKMRDILFSSDAYPYLMANAKERLATARHVAQVTGMPHSMLIHIGGSSWVLFPWLGTRPFRTLKRYLSQNAGELSISEIRSEGCCYITFKGKGDLRNTLLPQLRQKMRETGIDTHKLMGEGESPIFDKYDPYIPSELLREAYATDRLSSREVLRRFCDE